MKPQTGTTVRRRNRTRVAALAFAAACLLALAAAPSALAIGFTGLNASPADTQAGANSNFTIHVGFTSPADDVKNIRIGLPPGQIGNPNATPKCTLAEFNSGPGCADATQVGSVVTSVAALGLLPLNVNGKLFNLVPNPGEPARFGIELNPAGDLLPLGQIKLQSAVELRPDFGLDTVINDIPNTAAGIIPIDITAMDVTLFGSSPVFARNPTSCGQATTNFSATSYGGATTVVPATGQASYTPTNCGALPFSPTFEAKLGAPGATAATTKPPVSTVIRQDPGEAGLLTAQVFLPGILGSDMAPLLNPCSDADFQAGTCPAASVIGSAVAASPLLSAPLAGPVVTVERVGQLPDIGLDLRGELPLKLKGSIVLGATTGIEFDNLPDIPIADFALTFNANGLVVTNVDLCTTPAVFSTTFTAHSGAVTQGQTTATVEGCGPSQPVKKAKKCAKKKKKKKAKKKGATSSKKKGKKKRRGCKKKRKKKKGKKRS